MVVTMVMWESHCRALGEVRVVWSAMLYCVRDPGMTVSCPSVSGRWALPFNECLLHPQRACLLWGLVLVGPPQVVMGLRGGGLWVGLAPAHCSLVVPVGPSPQPRPPIHVAGAIRVSKTPGQAWPRAAAREAGGGLGVLKPSFLAEHVYTCEIRPLCVWLALRW